jgi:hypothetical protein
MYLSLGVFITGHSYSHYLSFIVTVFSSQDVESTEINVFFTFYRYKKTCSQQQWKKLYSCIDIYLNLGVLITGYLLSHYLSFIVTVFSSQCVESTKINVFFTFYRYKKHAANNNGRSFILIPTSTLCIDYLAPPFSVTAFISPDRRVII